MDNYQYYRRPFNPITRVLVPLLIYWGIGLLCQFIVTASYMVAHANELLAAYESEAKLQAFMEEAFRFIFRFSTETTAVGALIMLPICIYMIRKDKRMRAFSGIKENVWKGPAKIYPLTVGFGVTAGIVVNNLLILSNIRAISQSYQTTSEALYSAPLATQLICLGIIVPILEECLYRGVIYRRVRDMSSWKKAAVISSLIFGFVHANLVQAIYGFVFGLALCWLYEKQTTLKVPVLLHCTVNIVSVIMTATDGYLWIFKTPVRMGIITVACAALASGIFVLLKGIHSPEQ
ncbi:CPBP family intramembrane glutamic endopeptidase [Sellimonas sp.]|uniref:CPBP family intramembrane glutamic endopeptidase n=1 Tax=Sellimonas sp. TaxID=2021466 RepID=UPI00257CE63E|nr:CPBP family intramembrane metalloprotease [Sellimonas sp.]